ncbi:unnamed protein product, partial [Mesorhabditis belari]|uniref:RRM domain-containing protein n=2 Tax=Mesorhabditis belari TaxID=2138241 RepID=A0AAF3F7K0_9BILA
MQRRAVALALRTAGDNSAENLGSDGSRLVEIGVSDGQSHLILPVVEGNSHLGDLFRQIEIAAGPGALLVCRGPCELRQVIHPLLAQEGVTVGELFLEFVNMMRLDAIPSTPPMSQEAEEIAVELTSLIDRFAKHTPDEIALAVERISLGVDPTICRDDESVEGEVVVRARGLPWQASDTHVAQFFAGLNIAPGGVALCLSAEGRRNGEALVRFVNPEMRALALKRHRHFLLSRYIEVYRASGDEFLQVAAGCSSEAMIFVSRGASVIIRMRGLPYDCAEQQIKEFFLSEPEPAEMMDSGVMFVTRPDGRPTGDAFVLFGDEETGLRALKKHRQTIGSRYIELFRSTTAEVNQTTSSHVRNFSDSNKKRQQRGVTVERKMVMKRSAEMTPPVTATRRDCVRLRGLPYEARVEDVVRFLGDHARNIVFQGVHMVFNAQGHPSGECFIQMNSEQAASGCAATTHNKFMNTGKKQRYIEVFQCSPDDMHLAPQQAAAPAPPLILPQVQPRLPFPITAPSAAMPLPFGAMYWPYPSPPVSPNMMLGSGGQVLVTGITFGVTAQDIMHQFTTPDTAVESVQMLRWPTATTTGEALLRVLWTRSADGSTFPTYSHLRSRLTYSKEIYASLRRQQFSYV